MVCQDPAVPQDRRLLQLRSVVMEMVVIGMEEVVAATGMEAVMAAVVGAVAGAVVVAAVHLAAGPADHRCQG